MSTYLGLGSGAQTAKPVVYGGLQVSNSQMDMPIVLFWGQRRLGTTAIDYDDFRKNSSSGKGIKSAILGGAVKGGKGSAGSTYSAAVILALCEGPVDSVVNVFPSGSTTTVTTLAKLNMTLFNGTAGQAPWSYMVTKHPTKARAYAYTAYVVCPDMNLGSSASVPDNGFETVRTMGFSYTHTSDGWKSPSGAITSAVDCMMSDIVPDFLTSTQYGMGFVSGDLASLTQYALYQRAQGFFFSPCLKGQEAATSIIDRWAQLSNSWIYWAGTQFQFVPLGDSAVTGNGVTYTPDNAAAYDLTLADFIDQQNPVKVTRADPADCYNRTVITVNDRTQGYINNPIEWKDDPQEAQYGKRDGSSTTADEICDPAVGKLVAQLVGKRAAWLRRTFSFKLSYRFIRCLPGTVVTLTTNRLNKLRVRITGVDEDGDGNLSMIAEDFPGTIGTYTSLTQDSNGTGGNTPDQNEDPGAINTPAVVEPSSAFTGGKARLLIGASGGSKWGGSNVYISFDQVTYSPIGQITAPAAQGLLTAPLASHVDPDTVNTLSVDMTESQTVPQTTVTHADADALRTLSQVVAQPTLVSGVLVIPTTGELLAFGDVAITGTFGADLTYLRRGEMGSVPGAHSTGDQFTVVDVLGSTGTFIDYELPPQYIGQPIWFKFTSYNVFGPGFGEEDLSTVAVYKYTPTGAGYGGGTGGVPTTPTGLAVAPVSGQNLVTWNANPATDNVTTYKVYRGTGTSVAFGSCAQVFAGLVTSWMDTAVVSGQAYTYYLVATNAIGNSTPEGPANTTSSTITYPFRAVGGTPGRKPLASEELFNAPMVSGDTLPNGLTGSSLQCEVAPTSNWIMTLFKNGVSIGTGTILAAATTGTFSFSGPVVFATNDIWTAVAPAVQDATLVGAAYRFMGTRTQ